MARYGYRIGAESSFLEAGSDAKAEEAVRELARSWLNPGESLRWVVFDAGDSGMGGPVGDVIASGMAEAKTEAAREAREGR